MAGVFAMSQGHRGGETLADKGFSLFELFSIVYFSPTLEDHPKLRKNNGSTSWQKGGG